MSRFRTETIGDATLILADCREVLADMAPVDAVVTDAPYGIGENNTKNLSRGTSSARVRRHTVTDYGAFAWDKEVLSAETMAAVLRAGRWQIIFGGNYYALPPTSCWLVWDKLTTGNFADCELAWTNMPKAVRRLRYLWNGCMRANGEVRGDHPTQKPIGVMKWVLSQLPFGTRTIVDPLMGSGTTGVACTQLGLSFIGIEREEQYFDAACRRIASAYAQPVLFDVPTAKPAPGSPTLFEVVTP